MVKVVIWLGAFCTAALALVCIWFVIFASNGMTSPDYQHDADIVRLRDIDTMGAIIKEYHEKMGKYPLQGETDLQYYVLVGTENQVPEDLDRPSYEHLEMSTQDFAARLSRDLERTVTLPFDPQLRPNVKPNFYIYMVEGNSFYFAVHLHESYEIAKRVGAHYYKLEISNNPDPPNYWDYDDLMANEDYQAAVSRPMKKPDFFEQLPHRQE